jgi:transposase
MGFGVLFVRTLTEQELEQLRMLLRHVQAGRLKDRYQAIWFSHLGKSVQEIARLLDMSEDTVRRWIHTFEKDGFDGLADDYRSGRPSKATGRYIERLTELIHISPLRMGCMWASWALKLLAAHMEARYAHEVDLNWTPFVDESLSRELKWLYESYGTRP